MLCKCSFDPKRDICAVVPDLSVDLVAAIENGVVLDTGVVTDYNNIEDPHSIHGRVRDAFDALDAQRSILKKGAADAKAASDAKAAAAAASAAPATSSGFTSTPSE